MLTTHRSHPHALPAACALAALFAGLLSIAVHAQAEPAAASSATLTITVTGIESAEGIIAVEVLRGEAQFKGEGSTASMLLPAATPAVTVQLPLPAGEYAVRVMHDEDSNGELKTNMLGMPTEPWGMSNDATGKFGPPKWDDARFALEDSATQTITLR
ncbi:MAG: DUF2141 domain-containing protein [Pseudomonadota bacterium]